MKTGYILHSNQFSALCLQLIILNKFLELVLFFKIHSHVIKGFNFVLQIELETNETCKLILKMYKCFELDKFLFELRPENGSKECLYSQSLY